MNEDDNTKEDVFVEMNCPRCKLGFMRPTGRVVGDSRDLQLHQCIRCGFFEAYKEIYPVKVG